jgi:putative oxidoreductase
MKNIDTKKTCKSCFDTQILIARLLIIGMFAMSAFSKITGFAGSAGYAASSWVPLPGELLIVAAIIMEVFGVVAILSGWKFKQGAQVLALYTFLATIMFHIGPGQQMAMFKNFAVMGGLIAISQLSPGKFSCFNKK